MLGLRKGTVKLVKHDTRWAELFASEKARLMQALGDVIVEMHHIGSTAIPDMPAKPVIDMMAVVEELDQARALAPRLTDLGYVYHPDMDEPDKVFYTSGQPVTHHLHFLCAACPRRFGYLAFRDRMISDHSLARRYISLKEELARKYRNDRQAYTAAKDGFIKEVLKAEKE